MSATAADAPAAGAAFEQALADALGSPRVVLGTGFGSVPGARVDGRVFAMLCRGELVVKLPRGTVDALVARGVGERFDARLDGRRMKEWASVPLAHQGSWPVLVADALRFVGGDA